MIAKRVKVLKMNVKYFIKVQYMDVSWALHTTVEPNTPKIPEPMIPPLPDAVGLVEAFETFIILIGDI